MLCHPWPPSAGPELGPGSVWVPLSPLCSSVCPLLLGNLMSEGLWGCLFEPELTMEAWGCPVPWVPSCPAWPGHTEPAPRAAQSPQRLWGAGRGPDPRAGSVCSWLCSLPRLLAAPWHFSIEFGNFSVSLGTLGCGCLH